MEKVEIPSFKIIHEQTAEDFERVLNASVEELAECKPEVKFVPENGFCAYLTYHQKEKTIIESVRDEFHLEGIYYHCRNCPHLDIPEDRRVKYGHCKYTPNYRTNKNGEACELFYKWLKQNAVEVIEDSELVLW